MGPGEKEVAGHEIHREVVLERSQRRRAKRPKRLVGVLRFVEGLLAL